MRLSDFLILQVGFYWIDTLFVRVYSFVSRVLTSNSLNKPLFTLVASARSRKNGELKFQQKANALVRLRKCAV